MQEFKAGDHVIVRGRNDMKSWDGLRATVVNAHSDDQCWIGLKDGYKRPDGYDTNFMWPSVDLEPDPHPPTYVQELVSKIEVLESALSDRNAKIESLHNEMTQFRDLVRDVAIRYAREHDWCSVVSDALEEMGIEAVTQKRVSIAGSAELEMPICSDDDVQLSVTINGEVMDTYYWDISVEDVD